MNMDGPTHIILFQDPPGPRSPDRSAQRADSAKHLGIRTIDEKAAAKLTELPEARRRHRELGVPIGSLADPTDSGESR